MASPPIIEWRTVAGPNNTISSLAFVGTGYNSAIPAGTTSTSQQVRVYNNFANAASIADATNCTLAVYDDTVHQGLASTTPTTAKYVQVEVNDYNGVTTGQDTSFFPIGGATKHLIPVNSGTIGGSAANYVTVTIQIVIPSNATQGAISQGIWMEYNSTA
jgi:hypothetical protein